MPSMHFFRAEKVHVAVPCHFLKVSKLPWWLYWICMNNAEEEIRKRGETDLQSRDTHQEQKMGARACQRRLLGHVSKGGEKTVLYVGKLLILHSTLHSLSRSPFTTATKMYQCTIELCHCKSFNVFLFSLRKMIVLVSKSPVHFSKLQKLRLFWLPPTSKVNAFKPKTWKDENESENILAKWKTSLRTFSNLAVDVFVTLKFCDCDVMKAITL